MTNRRTDNTMANRRRTNNDIWNTQQTTKDQTNTLIKKQHKTSGWFRYFLLLIGSSLIGWLKIWPRSNLILCDVGCYRMSKERSNEHLVIHQTHLCPSYE
jgi:hypothetical protein